MEGVGSTLLIYVATLLLHLIVNNLDSCVTDRFQLFVENLQNLWNYSIYVRLLDYLMFQLIMSICLSLTIVNFKLALCIASFVLSLIFLLTIIAFLVILIKRFLMYRELERRLDVFKKFYCHYDGVEFKKMKYRFLMA